MRLIRLTEAVYGMAARTEVASAQLNPPRSQFTARAWDARECQLHEVTCVGAVGTSSVTAPQ